jgi:hypothetical protein
MEEEEAGPEGSGAVEVEEEVGTDGGGTDMRWAG